MIANNMIDTLRDRERKEGSSLVLTLFLLLFLTALSMAQALLVQKNVRQSDFYNRRSQTRTYAESGAYMALHELRYNVSGGDAVIGTSGWTALNDLGVDGIAATGDEGEGDGIPTIGEANVSPVSIGPAGSNLQFIAYSEATGWPNVTRIVSTVSDGEATTTVETYVEQMIVQIPKVGAVYLDPGATLDLNGNAFLVSGHDTNPDGTPGPETPKYGLSTSEDSANPGDNGQDIIDQVDADEYDQIIGLGSDPSVGETTESVDIVTMFDTLKQMGGTTYAPGTYSNVSWGDSSDYQVSYVDGDLHLSGSGYGAGVLLVSGNLEFSGDFTYEGVVICLGDIRQTGGGSGVHIYGSLFVNKTVSVVDTELTIGGTSDLMYSSVAVDNVNTLLSSILTPYNVVYWNFLK